MRDNKRPVLTVLVIGPVSGAQHWAIYITSYNCPPQLSPLYDAHTYAHSIFMLTRARIPHSVRILKWPSKTWLSVPRMSKLEIITSYKWKGMERKVKERK